MKNRQRILSILFLTLFSISYLQGQQAVVTSGGIATGTTGSVSYTVGQIAYQTFTGTGGTLQQGVQQPWEVSTPVAVAETEDISLLMNVYPNPTSGAFKLIVGTLENRNLRFRLYDMNGLLLQDKKIDSEETEIFLQDLSSSMYFLKIINNASEIKVFKIVKK
ncbi:MAG TPA: T9SS type A sorting domain-containing protein [Bacteroidales bacterium]|jgi:hypothetical protein|nr:T9SS type A sorting domain-containing protein [Bacteroidales bacterium]HOS72249.1 T9SS type A sorting domain-containing protein [Bacteroidales bacterium]HQH25451.1 T9SS type A sorting domain-containing protein [Bacteroidales bacterium]HQJ83134.1 T9SS type A sorting domain-containing protein [Bacteroidales bacterium]